MLLLLLPVPVLLLVLLVLWMLLLLTSLLQALEPNISAKFAAAEDCFEIDMFAFSGDAAKAFEPYLPAMKAR